MHSTGGFTLPGEAGHEKYTLFLAEQWGADTIRDSDGTQLSPEILQSGIPIYSTLCLVRSVNQWARQNTDKLQRNFLMSKPQSAQSETVIIHPLSLYFEQQFQILPEDDPREFWQVFDRTTGEEHLLWDWNGYDVIIRQAVIGHVYTVNFLAVRIWEEISMYNHLTNQWGEREHLMAVEPRYPETQAVLLAFLEQWCREHPHTSVVRFTSLFYNFCWIWGSAEEQKHIYTDWAGYDFTVNPVSLRAFEAEYGYRMTSEDFINRGFHTPAHNPPSAKLLDWIDFTGKFVREFGKKCVEIVHRYGKKAYVFYDDSWIGLEPWNGHFPEFGFDGLIKCVFNAFEARLCAGVNVPVHELRLHPYLFPTGLTGEPTFAPGGHPETDARHYWASVRRALLRVRIDRIGLGGYIHLTEAFPEFRQEIKHIADEFRMLRSLHQTGTPWTSSVQVGVLHSWGALRTWNCSGHMHEHPELPLNHLHEALAGLPITLRAISFREVMESGVPDDIQVLLNAGRGGDAWSGGGVWLDDRPREAVSRFVIQGGALLGVGEPSAADGGFHYFQAADILGVDREAGQTICFPKFKHHLQETHFITEELAGTPDFHNAVSGVYALDSDTLVLSESNGQIYIAAKACGEGRSVYLSGFTYSPENTRLLYRALLWAARREQESQYFLPDNLACECSYFPDSNILAAINNTESEQSTNICTPRGTVSCKLEPLELRFLNTMEVGGASKP